MRTTGVVVVVVVVIVVQTMLYDMCVSTYTPVSMQLIRVAGHLGVRLTCGTQSSKLYHLHDFIHLLHTARATTICCCTQRACNNIVPNCTRGICWTCTLGRRTLVNGLQLRNLSGL